MKTVNWLANFLHNSQVRSHKESPVNFMCPARIQLTVLNKVEESPYKPERLIYGSKPLIVSPMVLNRNQVGISSKWRT